MTNKTVFIFISPHLDDVIIPCGGYIHRLTKQGMKVVVATVVTADDTSRLPPSWLARRNLKAWGIKDRVFAARREEDKSAAKTVGADVAHLGFLDCIFRRDADNEPLYTKRVKDIPVHPLDWNEYEPALQNALREFLKQYSSDNVRIVCPLAIGGHVDHILVRQAVEAVSDPGKRIYYEDFPYSLHMEAYQKNVEQLASRVIVLSDEDLEFRLKASAFYRSQIPGLFPSQLDIFMEILRARLPIIGPMIPVWNNVPAAARRMDAIIRAHNSKIGGERYWTVIDSAELFGIAGEQHLGNDHA
jgi:LmbE family N-acetylglucosaminyl deacetylase